MVGAVADDTNGVNSGSAYVFDLSSGTPTIPVASLHDPSATAADFFGQSVAVSGNSVVVGAPLDDNDGTNAGRAYIYDLLSATPALPVSTISPPTVSGNDQFGYAVTMSGNHVVVGGFLSSGGVGAAYVYDIASATPNQPLLTLNNPSPDINDTFGFSVSIDGSTIVVAAPFDDTSATDAGTTYVYDLASFAPTQPILTLQNPAPDFNDQFGYAVTVNGDYVAVAAPLDDAVNTDEGAAYLFKLNNTAPTIDPQAFDVDEDDQGTAPFGTVLAFDTESNVAFQITGGTGAALFAIDQFTGDSNRHGNARFRNGCVLLVGHHGCR